MCSVCAVLFCLFVAHVATWGHQFGQYRPRSKHQLSYLAWSPFTQTAGTLSARRSKFRFNGIVQQVGISGNVQAAIFQEMGVTSSSSSFIFKASENEIKGLQAC